ncbi:MAG: hypothetical protein JGK17_17035 [Microcoleus sp. PH2017_10_PVI_O_A]|uniref:hypothetical protein n=1 Tax=unclassified Microcoleus TaxID=2642155 RepID=UPI001D80EC17|nr:MULTISPECIES: hypothetical protein [unclassified Microcoleus]MCC3407265.1 hypothetical protein [Microcoleus sp. PH2017_10_PVI_O_A]MCC3461341.1 hypothetical protein [Microcoleus sp. PH2017_11_PCY_U_A]MCC3479796.1 hypothetical protein [Microcoleus sp. PH2017_12_PCY_D_A]MCC3530534.1 hypothetical protein [Microcoleus sp. PH2017_21_RUC_O_A]MCC3542856.1 hypothetical protein [Microcoleus sp. PH2017_22_RUC_O_B]
MTTLKASSEGRERIKQARSERGCTIEDPRSLVEATQELEGRGRSRLDRGPQALCRRPLAANFEAFFRRTRTH